MLGMKRLNTTTHPRKNQNNMSSPYEEIPFMHW